MNYLSIFVLIPLLMLGALWLARDIKQIRGVMLTGSSLLLVAAGVLTALYLQARAAGDTAEMLFTDSVMWYPSLHIGYSVGVDGISVAMLLLSAIIVFTGVFASWRLQPLTKEYFLWYTLFPDSYPLEVFADFDHNGIIDNKDVEYLLWHTLFPEDYPLA